MDGLITFGGAVAVLLQRRAFLYAMQHHSLYLRAAMHPPKVIRS